MLSASPVWPPPSTRWTISPVVLGNWDCFRRVALIPLVNGLHNYRPVFVTPASRGYPHKEKFRCWRVEFLLCMVVRSKLTVPVMRKKVKHYRFSLLDHKVVVKIQADYRSLTVDIKESRSAKELSLNNFHILGRYPLPVKAQPLVLLWVAGSGQSPMPFGVIRKAIHTIKSPTPASVESGCIVCFSNQINSCRSK